MLPDKSLRPLAPRLAQRPPQWLGDTEGDEGNSKGRKRRRPYISKACNFCREKKNACDSQPVCSQCLRRGLACEYVTVNDTILKTIPAGSLLVDKDEALSNADAADLLSMLKRVPDDDALEALQLLRSGNNPAQVASALRRYDVGFSQVALNRAILPPPQSSLEFELMMRHPISYPTWAPIQPTNLDLEILLQPSSSRRSRIGPMLSLDSTDSRSYFSHYGQRRRDRSPDEESLFGTLEPTALYDNRLLSIDITQWTNVPITNEFSIAVLQLYLETDHPMMPLIDVDLLLDGLLGKNEFCSRILLSALFAWACQGYAIFEPEATLVGHAFYNEAKEMWEKAKETRATDHVCTAAAVQYLSLTAMSFGTGIKYTDYIADVLQISKRLDLFNVDPSQNVEIDFSNSAEYRQAKAQLAWVLFTCLTFFSLHLHERLIEHPPRAPIPGNDIRIARDTDKSTVHKRRASDTDLLREHCHLSLIVHGMVQTMYGSNQIPYADAITLAFAEQAYKRLLSWADGLPLEMAQGDHCTHHSMVLHIYYHVAILQLFRPLLRQNGAPRQRLLAFKSEESTPDAVSTASINQLKRIVISYRQNYSESEYCLFWHPALLYVANAMLSEAREPQHNTERNFFFRLCVACYQTLYTGFRLAKALTLSLLAMALEKGVVDHRQARAIQRDLERRRKHSKISDQVPVALMVDLNLAVTNPSAAQAENLVRKFHEFQLYETDGSNGTPSSRARRCSLDSV
ncbi:hypothetical protein LZ30DRAFT_740954 [Colletotrichum cereale]|nr:hypothetical protein LZ30DRAFT_740954 [Colletotrichum cereale]